jgi:hypothetical protein
MPLMLSALYDALLSAGAEEPLARRAAEETAQLEARFAAIETRLGRIETRLEQTPTKADLADMRTALADLRADVAGRMTDLTRYILIGSSLISAAILAAKFFVP